MGRRFLIVMILAPYLFLLGGCGGKLPYLQKFKVASPVQACSVGVLPLINTTKYDQGDKVLYRILLAELVKERSWRLALEGDVRSVYQDLRIRPWRQPRLEQLRIIGSRLGVDLLIGGEVQEMDEQVRGERANPRMKVVLKVYNGKDGTLLWATYHSRQGTDYRKLMHFGLSTTISQLAKKMMKEILILWEEQELLLCSD